MSDDVRADALRDLESDRAFLDGTSPFDAPGAGYRLNTWVRTRIPALLAELDRMTSQRDQAIELGTDIDLLASAALRTIENQRNAAQRECDEARRLLGRRRVESLGKERAEAERDAALATLQQVREWAKQRQYDGPPTDDLATALLDGAAHQLLHILDGGAR
ncbi:hypothetical protein [Gordonia alkanivorans]|uniref:hypothetical protein n=1 Tax=Gordonia alkanivorans TaxID=84096 RepID=UPI0024B8186E|nr:hypothetical protein [Gordonia alkanivorans]MDJ0010124.1 hypothetical protein [Gordonia alkanivorans]MDJ0495686.1 hypothetical protein [Gordonia alkanivorans]